MLAHHAKGSLSTIMKHVVLVVLAMMVAIVEFSMVTMVTSVPRNVAHGSQGGQKLGIGILRRLTICLLGMGIYHPWLFPFSLQ